METSSDKKCYVGQTTVSNLKIPCSDNGLEHHQTKDEAALFILFICFCYHQRSPFEQSTQGWDGVSALLSNILWHNIIFDSTYYGVVSPSWWSKVEICEKRRIIEMYSCISVTSHLNTPQQDIWGEASGQVMCIFNTSDIDLGQSLGDCQLTFHLYVAW